MSVDKFNKYSANHIRSGIGEPAAKPGEAKKAKGSQGMALARLEAAGDAVSRNVTIV
jgi:hypothetical protein